MAKHDEVELELLGNLLSFTRKKHSNKSISEIEKKFGSSARELVNSGEISEDSLKEFCDIEAIDVPEKKSKSKTSDRSNSSYGGYTSDPCGSGGNMRSVC